jgi:hypothetical protein
MWWSFAITMLLLTDPPIVRLAGLACLGVALARRWGKVRRKPGVLAFVLFSLAVTGVFEYAGKDFRAATVPFTGWVAQGPYMSSILFAVLALLSDRRVIRFGVVALLGLPVVFGLVEWYWEWPRASWNPYLAISMWRPVWTIAVPLFWIAVLLVELRLMPQQPELGAEAA